MLLSTVPEVRLTDLGPVLTLPTGNIPNSSPNVLSQVSCLPYISSKKGVNSWLTITGSLTSSSKNMVYSILLTNTGVDAGSLSSHHSGDPSLNLFVHISFVVYLLELKNIPQVCCRQDRAEEAFHFPRRDH